MKKWVRVSLLGLSAILVAGGALGWFALMTAPGARLVLDVIEPRIPGALSYDGVRGRLIGPLELEGFRYANGAVEVRAQNLALDWHPLALLDDRLHLERLYLQGVDGKFSPEELSGDDEGSEARHESQEEGSNGGFSLAVEFDRLSATGVTFVVGGWAALRETSLSATGTLDGFAVELSGQLSADPLPISTVALAASGSLKGLALDSLSLVSDLGTIEAAGDLDWQPELTWDLIVHADSLRPAAIAEIPADWPGWLSLRASTRGSLTGGAPIADIAVDTLNGSVRGYPISGRAALEVDGSRILVPDTDLEWGPLSIRADGVYADTIDFEFEIEAPDLAGVLPGGRGSVRAEGTASGPRSRPHVDASLSARGVAYRDIALQRAEGRVFLDLTPNGAVDAEVRMSGLEAPQVVVDELNGVVRGRVDAHRLNLQASSDDYALAIGAEGSVTGAIWRGEVGELTMATPLWGDWSLQEPVGLDLSQGTVSLGDLCLASAEGRLCAAGEFAGEDTWKAVASLDGIPLAIARLFLPPELVLEGTVDGSFELASSETALPNGRAEISLSSGYAAFALSDDTLRVSHVGDMKLDSSAEGLSAELVWMAALTDGDGSARINVGFASPDLLSAERGDFLTALVRGDWKAKAAIEELQLARLDAFLPSELGIEGALNATLDAKADTGRVSGALVLEPSSGPIELAGDAKTGVLELRELSVHVDAADAGVTGMLGFSLHGLGGRSLGDMRVEARSDAIVLGRPPTDRVLEADVEGSIDLATLTTLTHGFVDATGRADLDFSLRHEAGDFEALGRAQAEGRAEVEVLGIALEDLDLTIDADGERLAIDGRVSSGEGHLTLSGEKVWGASTSMQLQGDRFLAAARDELRLELTPDLRLEASGTRIDLSGEVVVPNARIELLEVPSTGVGVSSDVVLVGVETEPEVQESRLVEIFTDVRLSLGDDVSFRGLGLTTRIDGSLRVTDRPGTPSRGDGVLRLRDGRFRGFGLSLVVDPGEMIFSGPLDQPRLQITAYRQADDGTRAGVEIDGPAGSPRVEIYSEPRVSDQEALSYMFSGQPLDRGSTQLNRANAQQAQAEGGAALMGSNVLTQAAGMAIGLDETRIDAGDRREDAEFIAGKYVSPRLFVAYVTGLFENVNVLRVRYTLYRGFRLQAETGTRQTVDLLYRFDVGR